MKQVKELGTKTNTLASFRSLLMGTTKSAAEIGNIIGNTTYVLPDNVGYIASVNASVDEGSINYNTGYRYSDLFQITGKGAKLTTNALRATENVIILSKYDKYGNYVSALKITAVGVEEPCVYTLTENTEYFRLCTSSAIAEISLTIEKFASLKVLSQVDLTDPRLKLFGKKFNVIGDSYVKGHTLAESQTWSYKLAQKYEMAAYRNYGINGNTISSPTDGVAVRYADMDNDADIICVQAGKNDYNTSVTIGNNTDADLTTFKGALNVLCSGLLTKYPGKTIFFMNPWNHADDVTPYAEAMVEITGRWSIPCFDTHKRSQVYMRNAAFKTTYTLGGNDVSHLNEAGMEYFMLKVESYLLSIL